MFWSHAKAVIDDLPNGIRVALEPEERPKFKRTYTKELTSGRRITLTARTFIGSGRYFHGELTQPGGRWVLFDPREIADKILDPALVPLVEAFCKEAIRLDRIFMENQPGEFVDEGGSKWHRV